MKSLYKLLLVFFILEFCLNISSCMFFKIDEPKVVTKNGLELVWADEFDYSGVPDTSKWKYQTGANGWGNNELQNYVDNSNSPDTAIVQDGYLKIKAYYDKENGGWKSARLNSKESWTYGYIEARLKVTDKKGAWPAFWMMPQNSIYGVWPNSGEIDIMENAPSTCGNHYCFSTLHAKGHSGSDGAGIGHKNFGENLCDEWHTFAIKWDSSKISALYDDVVMDTFYNNGTGSDSWPYDKDFYIILNLAIGGNLGNSYDSRALQNSEVNFLIDYVRVYQ